MLFDRFPQPRCIYFGLRQFTFKYSFFFSDKFTFEIFFWKLDFLSFLRISHYTNVFTFLNMPSDSITLEKSEFIKGIREDRLPNNFEESDVEIFYKLTDNYSLNKKSEINFESFWFFFHILKLFNKSVIIIRFLFKKKNT